MARTARIVIPNTPHHIIQRGNNRQDVFFTDQDRNYYLQSLAEKADANHLTVLGYCLMTDHVHIIASPKEPESLAQAIGRTNQKYTQYINRNHERSGHLWQSRFYSCPLDNKHLLAAMRYVERNPVRARLLRAPWRYTWSSAAAHCGDCAPAFDLINTTAWTRRWDPETWRGIIRAKNEEQELTAIRTHTKTGRPLVSARTITKLEKQLNRSLRPNPVGRPPKKD